MNLPGGSERETEREGDRNKTEQSERKERETMRVYREAVYIPEHLALNENALNFLEAVRSKSK